MKNVKNSNKTFMITNELLYSLGAKDFPYQKNKKAFISFTKEMDSAIRTVEGLLKRIVGIIDEVREHIIENNGEKYVYLVEVKRGEIIFFCITREDIDNNNYEKLLEEHKYFVYVENLENPELSGYKEMKILPSNIEYKGDWR